MSPRRFKRRTYIIVASGCSALTFSAATSVSSAWTTIRSAFPFTLSPTVNCQDILEPSKVARGGARPITPPARSEECTWQACTVAGVPPSTTSIASAPVPEVPEFDRHLSERPSGRAVRDRHRRYHWVAGTARLFIYEIPISRLAAPPRFLMAAHLSSPEKEKLEKSPWLTDR